MPRPQDAESIRSAATDQVRERVRIGDGLKRQPKGPGDKDSPRRFGFSIRYSATLSRWLLLMSHSSSGN